MAFRENLVISLTNNQAAISRGVRRYLPVVQLLVGLFLAFLGYAIGKDHLHLLRRGVRAPGVIVNYQQQNFWDSRRQYNRTAFMPIVQFQDGNNIIQFKDWMGSRFAGPLRQPVTVLYDPAIPSVAMIDRPTWNWLPWCPTIAVGLFLICVALPGILRIAREA